MVENKDLTDVATDLSSFTRTFCFNLQILDRDEGNGDSSEGEQEPEVWEGVSMEDLLCDVESREPCPEPTSKQTRTQKLTALVPWLVFFFLCGSLYAISVIMVWNGFFSFFSISSKYFLIYLVVNTLESG